MADISSVKLQDNQIYYFKDNSAIVSISRNGNTYTATRHDGTTFEFTQKDDNTTYTFEDGVNSFTVTPSNGTAQTVTVTPSIPNATQSSDGLMSATDKTKLDGVANGAEVNQNAFSNIKVGSTTLAADSKTDTLEFVAGDNITLTPTEVSDKITISSSYTNTTYTLTQDATDGHKFSLEGTDGYFKEITIPDANTTYTIEADTTNNKIKLIPSSGSAVSITVPFATNATNATNATKATGDESGNNIKNTYAASFSISDHTITLKNKNGTSLGTVTVPDNNTTYSFDTGDSNGQIKVTPSGGSAQNISVKGLGTAAFKNTTDTYSSSGTDPVTGKAVASALETLPTPMVFKGTLGTGGTISQLPTASASTVGNTYRVITNGTYAGQVAKDGDEFIGAELSSGVYSWVYIPSADEPSGTVTSVGITNGGGLSVSGSPITTSGTITISHADTSSQASVDNSGRTYIQDISLDTYGHVTKITSATETVVNTDRYVNSASFAYDSTNDNVKMTLTRAGSDTATVPANIPKVSSSSAGVVPKGAAVSSQSQSTKFLREDGTWAAPSYTTNTNTTYTIGTSGNTVTLTPSSGSVQSITVPFATNATNATKATQDANGDVIATTYRKLSNNDFDTINATEVNAGDLIVTGVGRFTNGLYGDLSGTATKVSNSLKIQLNGGTTEGTNQFTYDGSAAKTVNVTKSAIGLGNVDNTADANKSVASATTAGSATKATQDESGNNIKATYAASFSISDHTITLKNKNGVSLGTVTVPDNNDNTWRKVQVNGTDILGTATNTNPLNLKAGTNVSLSNSSGTVTITATDTNTTYSLSADTTNNKITLTPSSGSAQSITVPYATSAGSATDNTKVAKAGDTMTGILKAQQGIYSHGCGSSGGTAGYFKFATITVTAGYVNRPIILSIVRRNGRETLGTVLFSNTSLLTPSLNLYYNGDFALFYVKTGDSTWDLYVGKGESYGNVYFNIINPGQLVSGGITWEWTDTTVASLPEGYVTATVETRTLNISGSSTSCTGNSATATNLNGFTNTTTTGTAIDSATQNGHVYVTGASGIYGQGDGACFVQAYSTSWVAQIYQDYRTGQIALRGKNNGTWQAWRKVLDSSNYTDYTVKKDGTGASGTWGISISGNANKARLLGDETIRPASANTTTYNGALRYFLSTSSMTTAKPIADGSILSMEWDNNGGYAKQLYLDHSGGVKTIMQVRSQNGGTWGSWIPVGVFRQTTPTSGQVVITDGTDGGIKSSGYTIATSVPSGAVFTDTKNTAGSTDTSSKIFLVGATSQAANPQTYSDNEVYATSGVLTTKSVQVGGGSATMQYNTTTKSIDFVFAS